MSNTANTVNRSAFKRFISKPEFSVLLIFMLMFIVTAILQKNFFSLKSIIRNLNAWAPLVLLTMGQAIVIISGGIDLSAGSALSLFTCVLTWVMREDQPVSGFTAILITLAVVVVVGVVNGLGIGYLRIPPVIATFATSYIWLGAALFIRPTPGGESVAWFRIFYSPKAVDGLPQFLKGLGDVIPPSLVLVLIAVVIWAVVKRQKTGRYIYAVGSSSECAYQSGINTALVQMKACLINSFFIFLAALFFVGQNQSGDARMGDPLTLKAVAAAVVGGIALSGGRGSVYFSILGALIISLVSKIIFFARIPYAFQTMVGGLIVIVAIASSQIYSLYSRRSADEEVI